MLREPQKLAHPDRWLLFLNMSLGSDVDNVIQDAADMLSATYGTSVGQNNVVQILLREMMVLSLGIQLDSGDKGVQLLPARTLQSVDGACVFDDTEP